MHPYSCAGGATIVAGRGALPQGDKGNRAPATGECAREWVLLDRLAYSPGSSPLAPPSSRPHAHLFGVDPQLLNNNVSQPFFARVRRHNFPHRRENCHTEKMPRKTARSSTPKRCFFIMPSPVDLGLHTVSRARKAGEGSSNFNSLLLPYPVQQDLFSSILARLHNKEAMV